MSVETIRELAKSRQFKIDPLIRFYVKVSRNRSDGFVTALDPTIQAERFRIFSKSSQVKSAARRKIFTRQNNQIEAGTKAYFAKLLAEAETLKIGDLPKRADYESLLNAVQKAIEAPRFKPDSLGQNRLSHSHGRRSSRQPGFGPCHRCRQESDTVSDRLKVLIPAGLMAKSGRKKRKRTDLHYRRWAKNGLKDSSAHRKGKRYKRTSANFPHRFRIRSAQGFSQRDTNLSRWNDQI